MMHFRKAWTPLSPPTNYGLNSIPTFLSFDIKYPTKVNMPLNKYNNQTVPLLPRGWGGNESLFLDLIFANGTGELGSSLGQVLPKIQKMLLDTSLHNTQHYKVRIKGKVEQSRKRSCALLDSLVQ